MSSVKLQERNNIAMILFDQPDSKVNVLSAQTLQDLEGLLDKIQKKGDLKALVFISQKPGVFIAGADISEIQNITDAREGQHKAQAGQLIMDKIEDLSIPTIAVINGVALGGGCELALACQYRLATFHEKVCIGLPEVNLGFVPGFGGTFRLPRIIGLADSLTMILTGKPVDAKKALRLGLVDRLCPDEGLAEHILHFIDDILDYKFKPCKYRRKNYKGLAHFLNNFLLGHALTFYQAQRNVMKQSQSFYPAPLRAIDVIKQNFYVGREEGLTLESKTFGELAITNISKHLVRLFYLSEKYKKLQAPGKKIEPQDITTVGVIGAGVMGGGIAQLLTAKDVDVRMKDINYDALALGLRSAASIYKKAIQRRKLSKAQANLKMGRLTTALDYSGFQNTDMIIEAVVENIDVKKTVFKDLNKVVSENCILASNTSALSVGEMSKGCKKPGRVIGLHFFNPVHRMPLVEIITTPRTTNETIATTLQFVKRLGKTPILVKDSCGFVVNRILLAYINEAGRILEETAQIKAIDKVMTDFGMPMGPFLLSDEVGLDVGIKVLHILEGAFGERFKPVEIFQDIFDKNMFGKKNKQGFYIHQKPKRVNPAVEALLFAHHELNELECRERLLLIMINEAARCLQDHIVEDADAIDVGMIFGTGFPPFRGGLLRYADDWGITHIVEKCNTLEKRFNDGRFKPCPFLVNIHDNGDRFYKS